MTPPTPRWSLADTHCVWCGRENCDTVHGWYDARTAVASLRATVEAQGKVIERYAEFVAAYDAAQLVTESFAFHVSARDRLERAREALRLVVNEAAGDGE